MEGNVADFNHNSGNNDDDDATDLPQVWFCLVKNTHT